MRTHDGTTKIPGRRCRMASEHQSRLSARRPALAALLLALAVAASAQSAGDPPAATAPASAPAGKCHALLVTGPSGSSLYARRHEDWLKRFHNYLTVQAGVPAGNVTVLCGDKDFKDGIVSGPATSESVVKAITDMSKIIRPQDQFILVLIGHGSLSDSKPSLVMPGPDLTGDQLARALVDVRARSQIILNFSGSSGDLLKSLSRKGRINVAATSGDEGGEPVYAEFFLRGLESGRARGEGTVAATASSSPSVSAKGPVSVLEAYNWAAYQTALWTSRQSAQKDGTWIVNGKESVEIFKKLYGGKEDELGSRKLSDASDAASSDAVVEILAPREAEAAKSWGGRRIVNEHAMIEDRGLEGGASALRGDKGYEPLTGAKEGEEGFVAAQTVLGRTE